MNENQYSNEYGAGDAVAIIGMSGRFPGAATLEQFWLNLRDGVESIRRLSDEELARAGVDAGVAAGADYVKAAALLDGIELFDADFFGYTPREAEIMDPQQRLFLECASEALAHAGYDPHAYAGAIGIYGGTAMSAYLLDNLSNNRALMRSMDGRAVMMANDKDFLCTRVAYKLNLRGPAVVVQSACSTSLVAVHQACQSILSGECDMALAGGAAISGMAPRGYHYVDGGIFSRDGHCRAFDAQAGGTVSGNGVGLVLLKRLDAAIADGDTIHAVIRGSAVNNDGADKASFGAPSVAGQCAVIREAHAVAAVEPDTISYVEAHGTGTALGDPIEIRALQQAFGAAGTRAYCAIGSLKTNIGHLDTAAGVAGLIKTVLALKHGALPPSLHYTESNPHIDFAAGPFYVNAALAPWAQDGQPRRAGVSAFGIGGTNAHLVLEQAPPARSGGASRADQLLVVSARSRAALDTSCARLADFLAAHPDTPLADVAFTLHCGRRHFRYRRALTAGSVAVAIDALRTPAEAAEAAANGSAPVVFLFPGQGAQYAGMGAALYRAEAGFRDCVDECAQLLMPHLGLDLRTLLFPAPDRQAEAAAQLDRTEFTQPALFVIEYALASQLMAWGVRPDLMVGHSVGEYVAACLAGVFSLADGLALVAARGRLISALPPAAMLALPLPAAQAGALLGDDVWLAGVNGGAACTLAGSIAAIDALEVRLARDGIEATRLPVSHAFHSGLLDPVLPAFRAILAGVDFQPPRLAYLRNLDGQPAGADVCDPEYWVAHLRNTVQFSQCLAGALALPGRVLVEVGPGATLVNLARREAGVAPVTVGMLPRRGSTACSAASVIDGLGRLWMAGAQVDWAGFYRGEQRLRATLPGYPFERSRHWIEPDRRDLPLPAAAVVEPDAAVAVPSASPVSAAHGRPALATAYRAPASAAEQSLCLLWQDLLGLAPVGIDDDFYALGGHSLLTAQLASRIRSTFAVELPMRELFEIPTVAGQAARIEAGRAVHAATGDAIAACDRDSAPALSFAQQRLWFLDQLDHAAGAAYHMPLALRLSGTLDRGALQAALDGLVARHEILRTSFPAVDGQAVQRIAPAAGFSLSYADLGQFAEGVREGELERIAAAEQQQAFDLATGPLVRGRLLRLGEGEHVLLITQHHIVSDAWSTDIMVREVGALYAAFLRGTADPLPALPIQYADYAVWQRGWLQGEVLRRQAEFWKRHLEGAPALLQLPADRPRPPQQSHAGASLAFTLDEGLCRDLRALGRRHGTTMFMTLLAAWAVLLGRLSGSDDVVVGTPVANRRRAETEGLIGFFVNTLALRVRIEDDPDVATLLARVKQVALDGYEHQDLSFEQVVEMMQPVRSTSHAALFQVMLTMNTGAASAQALPGLSITPIAQARRTAQVDLTLALHDDGTAVSGMLEYATALFDAATVARFAEHFRTLLAGMAANEAQRVSSLPLLTRDHERLLESFNRTARPRTGGELAHRLFEARVRQHPAATALVFGNRELTYLELDGLANRIAHRLLDLGVGPDDRVAICTERGIEMVAAMLGVWKAGGCFVPLDPGYPQARLAYMLEDSAPVCVLRQPGVAPDLPDTVPVLALDEAGLDGAPEHDPAPRVAGLHGAHLAYLIYTSGSTGKPKGVMNHHDGLCNLIPALIDVYGVDADSRVLQFLAFGFDVCVSEVMIALCAGARLVLAPREQLLGSALPHTLAHHVISHLHATPAVLGALPPDAQLGRLVMITGGEPLPPALVQRFAPRHALFNSYGPTETTVCASVHRCSGTEEGSVPIGMPLANVRIHVLDRAGRPVPPGVTGEIHIGGAGVARGYFGREALTAERFVPDPFVAEAGARMYRTGDLGRWLADGRLDFVGRNDDQVKLRGFRIEPGEIEARLAACDGVREAVVVLREDSPGVQRLVAYLVAEADAAPSCAEVRSQLSASLAEYMVPSAYVMVPAFPLTPNGKIDRKALPAPDASAFVARPFQAPQGGLEILLAGLWQELLGVERVGRDDHFFELGGYSLLATRLVARIRDALGAEVPLIAVFKAPTLAALAEAVQLAQLAQFSSEDIDALSADIDAMTDEEVEMMLAAEAA